MDIQYVFRQAHKDRLEDAGIVQYRPSDGFGMIRTRRNDGGRLTQRLRLALITLVNLVAK